MGKKSVPLIDKEDRQVGEKMVAALEESGYFRLLNHGVSTELMAEMKEVARALTDLPTETKMRTLDPSNPHIGYTVAKAGHGCYEGLNLDDVALPGTVDSFCSQLDATPYQKEVLDKYASALHELSQWVGRKLMKGLGMEERELFKNYACQLKINRYNFGPERVGSIGGLLHTDPGFLTVLQDDDTVNGLEIVDETTGELIPVDPLPGSLVVSLGDIAQVWSNGRFSIAKHQVQCNVPNVRTSIAYFTVGPRDEKVETLPEFVDSDHPRRYVPFHYDDYRRIRIEKRSAFGEEGLRHFLAKSS